MPSEDRNITITEKNMAPPLLAVALLCVAFGLVLFTAWSPTLEHISDHRGRCIRGFMRFGRSSWRHSSGRRGSSNA